MSTDLRPKEVTEEEYQGPYRQLVGGLMWIVNMTRPDVMNAVQKGRQRSP